MPHFVPCTPRSSAEWCDYFEANAKGLLAVPWDAGPGITDVELAAVAGSIQQFQLGESSEGRNLIRAAAEYAVQVNDPDYLKAMLLFIGEEHRHARDLGRFLALAGVPLLRHNWVDSVFRRLRRGAGLESTLVILLTAELVAKVYYRAIRDATASPVLRRLCSQILRDELMHTRFHFERLGRLRFGRARWRVAGSVLRHRVLFGVACVVVWWTHRAALRAGGYGFARYWGAMMREFRSAVREMDPARYHFREPVDNAPQPESTARRRFLPEQCVVSTTS
ncbi:ferritin-like domain-containing protein [Fimbriiglobus ruber]|uniref:Putative membrane protein n=1 Tax=Fimbriiglobus ruber TaxID=1908690 RepID=A0A225DAM3_9BACT|nr:ferritin-like domain-containing protein [Fimbriiglobus ruber]OWK36714.1 putative membrane protein [Fimbriiglobus ruber]